MRYRVILVIFLFGVTAGRLPGQIQLLGEQLAAPQASELQAIGQQSVIYMPVSDAHSLIPVEFTYISVSEQGANPIFKPFTREGIIPEQDIILEADVADATTAGFALAVYRVG